jgi:hypothetical protein
LRSIHSDEIKTERLVPWIGNHMNGQDGSSEPSPGTIIGYLHSTANWKYFYQGMFISSCQIRSK